MCVLKFLILQNIMNFYSDLISSSNGGAGASPSPLLSTKCVRRVFGSHADSGITHHEMSANIVTIARIIGPSNQLLASSISVFLERSNAQFKVSPETGN